MIEDYLKQMTEMLMTMRHLKSKPNSYSCMEEFVMKNGKLFGKRIEMPRELKRGKARECFMNAFHLVDYNDDLIYAEGFATIPDLGLPVMHAWCVNKKGEVFDPTWKDGDEYFGVPFKLDFVRKTILQRKKYGVIDNWEKKWPLLVGDLDPKEWREE